MTDETLTLAGEFPPATEADWRRLVEAALKGASFDKRLVSQTYDGLRVAPLYPRAAGAPTIAGRPAAPWQVIQRVDHPDPKAANAEALHDLENGASGLALLFAGAPAARGFGVDIKSVDDLDRTLAGVMLDMIPLRLETAPFAGRPVATMMIELVARRKLDPAAAFDRLRPRSDRRHGAHGRRDPALAGAVATRRRDGEGSAGKGFAQGALHARRRPQRARCRRHGSAGARLRAGDAASPICGCWKRAAFRSMRRGGGLTFLVATGPDQFVTIAKHRALAQTVGARRTGERADPAAGLRRGRDRLADDDAARPLREHAAHDHGGHRRRRRRRRCDLRSAVHACRRPARPAGAARGAQHAADPAGGIEPVPRRRSGRRLRRHRGAHHRALRRRRGRCSRRSKRPAAPRRRSSKA